MKYKAITSILIILSIIGLPQYAKSKEIWTKETWSVDTVFNTMLKDGGAGGFVFSDDTGPGATGKSFIVTNSGGTHRPNGIDIYGADNRFEKNIPLPIGSVPYYGNFVYRPDSHELWIPMFVPASQTTIYTLNVRTNQLGEIHSGNQAADLDWDQEHNEMSVLVRVGNSWYLRSFDVNHNVTSDTFISNQTPVGIVYNPGGHSFVVMDAINKQYKIVSTTSNEGSSARPIKIIQSSNQGVGTYLRKTSKFVPEEGNLYVLNSYNNVSVFNGDNLVANIHIPLGLDNSLGLSYSPKTGEVYVFGNYKGGFIYRIKNKEIIGDVIKAGENLRYADYNDYDENMYFVDYTGKKVVVLSSLDNVLENLSISENMSPLTATTNQINHSVLIPGTSVGGSYGVVSVITPNLQN